MQTRQTQWVKVVRGDGTLAGWISLPVRLGR